MVRISILYPHQPGCRFDFPYYVGTHMPRAIELLREHPGFRGVSVEKGISGGAPGSAVTYVATCHFLFESADAFRAAFNPHVPELKVDIPMYTDIVPIIQINEVVVAEGAT